MIENLKSAIETWQGKEGKKRAILVIASEEIERNEEATTCGTHVILMGCHKQLVNAVKAGKTKDNTVANIFKEADLSILIDKLCK